MTNTKKLHRRTSEIFADVIESSKGDGNIRVQEILELLGEKSFCLPILLLALPNCLPIPNILAYSALTGIPIILLSMQMILGVNAPWLPHFITNHSFSRAKFAAFLTKILPYIEKIEHIFYPRMFFISVSITEKLVGIVFLLGIVLSLPIPFGNLLPGFAISFIAIGLMERDGLMIAFGMLFGVISCAVIFTAVKAILFALIGSIV